MTRNPETTSSTSVVARPFITLGRATCGELEPALRREWLVTNGLGGYASGTVAGLNTRRYHGLLVAALAPPVSRTVMVASMIEQVTYGGATTTISTQEFGDGSVVDHGFRHVEYFCLEGTIPVWRYAIQDAVIERRIWMDHGANTTWISYRLLRGTDNAWLTITPLVTYRDFHALTSGEGWAPSLDADEQSVTVTAFEGSTPFSMGADTGAFRTGGDWYWNFRRREETARGLNDHEDLYAVGQFAAELAPGKSLHLRLSSESAPSDDATESLHRERERQHALIEAAGTTHSSPEVQQLTLAADQFIVSRSNADGPAGSTIIAGYHWFNDWGRDTMIALPGLTLATGRPDVASEILRTFAGFVSDGLLPNNFPDQSGEIPGYNTADATLWFVLAVRAYFEHTADDQFLDGLYPTLVDIIERHIGGTRYEIGMDKDDFLLHAGEPGVQLTWMDAKVDGWVVTPRIGKPVEINALWYNAVRTVATIARSRDAALAKRLDGIVDRIYESFNRRFRSPDLDYLADVVDGPTGDDWTLRPNQIFAISLPEPLLADESARRVLEAVGRSLYTSYGLRSLAPSDPAYRGDYVGDRVQRDGGYHQGPVWCWLIGPYIEAHLKINRRPEQALEFLRPLRDHLFDAGLGSISEIMEGHAPHRPRGCIAQAWSVAEAYRVWRLLLGELHRERSTCM